MNRLQCLSIAQLVLRDECWHAHGDCEHSNCLDKSEGTFAEAALNILLIASHTSLFAATRFVRGTTGWDKIQLFFS